MNKEEFLSSLRERLAVFPDAEKEEYINYYREMIEDHMDDGFPEEKVIETIGSVDDVFAVILQETALTQLLKNKVKSKRKLKPWEILLWILGFPVWFPLAVVAFVLVWTLYIVLWTLVAVLYVVEFSFAIVAPVAAALAIFLLVSSGNSFAAGVTFSGALVCAGLALILFHPCILATKGTAKLAKKIWLGIKFLIIGKEKYK